MAKILITIARQLGSGGSFIGKALAKKLGYRYFDREILTRTTELLGAEESTLSEREEKLSGFLKNVIRPFILGSPETAYAPPPIRLIYDRDLFEVESKVIRSIGEKYDSVIVGRAANLVLGGEPGIVNTFIHSPREFRVKRLMEIYGIADAAEAGELVDKSDHDRAKFFEAMTGADWTDLRRYHLAIDSERVGFKAAEEMISLLVREVKERLGIRNKGNLA